jgi:virulence-associated protein VagC
MSKISGFDMGRDEFFIPSSRMNGQDEAVRIPANFNLNEVNLVVLARELSRSSDSFNNKIKKIKDHLAALEVDKTTDMVVMDKSFVTKLGKLVQQMESDFTEIVQIAQQLK